MVYIPYDYGNQGLFLILWVMQEVKTIKTVVSPQGPLCLDSSLGSEASEAASAKAMAIPSGFMSLGA